ncbi:hypothetical protein [Lactobacillus sp. ESL0681]|uniref:hypothetical protein n=1 Tax=Lactobacillus sp. ESL0681 TaxID=2983211 RepID=UPI0023F71F51|nr:hypothetical protein [Lactobacillus sp. ESL0681]WEV40320.1 hypothetical protein OZX59_09150 [Lactobacillus sp. ESL0681]
MENVRLEKLNNYIYFYLDKDGNRIPLIASAGQGLYFDDDIHPKGEMKKLILELLPKNQLSTEIFIWVDGTEFKIGRVDD